MQNTVNVMLCKPAILGVIRIVDVHDVITYTLVNPF